MQRLLLAFVGFALLLYLSPASSAQTTIRVVPTHHATIQLAVDASVSGDVIVVLPGTYSDFTVSNKTLKIVSQSGPSATTLALAPAASGGRVTLSANNLHFEGFTLRDAVDSALEINGDNAFIRDCIFENNVGSTSVGGGGLVSLGRPGAVRIVGGAIGTAFERCIFRNNTGADDVGPFGFGGTGAVQLFGSSNALTFRDCLFDGNVGGDGVFAAGEGCFGRTDPTPTSPGFTIDRCSFRGNQGGLAVVGAGGTMRASITDLVGTMTNSIVWSNAPPVFGASAFSSQITFEYCNVQGGMLPGPGNISANPQWTGATAEIPPTSPCHDAGDPVLAGGEDVEGQPRPIGGRIDMGCNEHAPVIGGSGEPVFVRSTLNGFGRNLNSKRMYGGEVLEVTVSATPGSSLGSVFPILLAQAYFHGSPPAGVMAYPEVQLDPDKLVLLFDGTCPFMPIPPGGLTFDGGVTPVLTGLTIRFQVIGVTIHAANGIFATSTADELTYP